MTKSAPSHKFKSASGHPVKYVELLLSILQFVRNGTTQLYAPSEALKTGLNAYTNLMCQAIECWDERSHVVCIEHCMEADMSGHLVNRSVSVTYLGSRSFSVVYADYLSTGQIQTRHNR